MKVIYEPKGAAREYAPLACNIYLGCTHGCKYCYAPATLRKKPEEFYSDPAPRKTFLQDFEDDCVKLSKRPDDENRRVLLSFVGDPYQPCEEKLLLTRQAIAIATSIGIKLDVLTKGKYKLVSRDFDIMKENGTRLGVSLVWRDDTLRKQFEPNASTVADRIAILKEAHDYGIETWISVEPVIYGGQALDLMQLLNSPDDPCVDFWKIGKLNHVKEEKAIKGKEKWMWFMAYASGSLPESKRLFKKSLVEAAKEEMALSDWKPFTKCPELEENGRA
ncbi:hypothetical protein J6U78_03685 [bacterium]|nr:hypothetical protein [bacterium]